MDSIQIVFLIAAISLLVLFALPTLFFFEKRPIYVIGLIFAVYLLECLPIASGARSITAAGISVFPMDLVALLLLVLSAPFLLHRLFSGLCRNDSLFVILMVFTLCLSLSYILGLKQFGVQAATNEFRSYLYLIAVAVYVSTLRMDQALWDSIVRIWFWVSTCLLLIAMIGFSDGNLSRSDRPLGAEETLFILCAGILAVFVYAEGRLPLKYLPLLLLFIPMVVVLQHRSVWVVALLAMILVFWLLPKVRGSLVKWGLVGTLVFGSIGGVVFGPDLLDALQESSQEAVNTRTNKNTSTFVWRLMGWKELLSGHQMDSLKKKAFGNTFGSGWERTMVTNNGVIIPVNVSPHSFYVQSLLRCGVVGLIAFLQLNFRLIQQSFKWSRAYPQEGGSMRCIAILIIATMCFYLVYGAHYTHGILFGSAIAWCRIRPAVHLEETES